MAKTPKKAKRKKRAAGLVLLWILMSVITRAEVFTKKHRYLLGRDQYIC